MTTETLPTVRHCEVTPTSLTIDPDTTFEEFNEIGETLISQAVHISEACPWWIGAFVNFGENRYGEKYAQVLDETRFNLEQLTRYAYVERNVAPEDRVEGVSMSHHYVVARLSPEKQRRYLEMAKVGKLSSTALRKVLDEYEPNKGETRGRPKTKKSFSEWLEIYFVDNGYTTNAEDSELVHVSEKVIELMQAAWDAK